MTVGQMARQRINRIIHHLADIYNLIFKTLLIVYSNTDQIFIGQRAIGQQATSYPVAE